MPVTASAMIRPRSPTSRIGRSGSGCVKSSRSNPAQNDRPAPVTPTTFTSRCLSNHRAASASSTRCWRDSALSRSGRCSSRRPIGPSTVTRTHWNSGAITGNVSIRVLERRRPHTTHSDGLEHSDGSYHRGMRGIVGYGAYLPYWRLQRSAIGQRSGSGGGRGDAQRGQLRRGHHVDGRRGRAPLPRRRPGRVRAGPAWLRHHRAGLRSTRPTPRRSTPPSACPTTSPAYDVVGAVRSGVGACVDGPGRRRAGRAVRHPHRPAGGADEPTAATPRSRSCSATDGVDRRDRRRRRRSRPSSSTAGACPASRRRRRGRSASASTPTCRSSSRRSRRR